MPAWVGWALAAIVLLVIVVWLAFKMRGKGAGVLKAGAQMLAEWHKQNLKNTQAKIDKLNADFNADHEEVLHLEEKLAKQKAKLNKKFEEQGLSADEIAKQFAELDL